MFALLGNWRTSTASACAGWDARVPWQQPGSTAAVCTAPLVSSLSQGCSGAAGSCLAAHLPSPLPLLGWKGRKRWPSANPCHGQGPFPAAQAATAPSSPALDAPRDGSIAVMEDSSFSQPSNTPSLCRQSTQRMPDLFPALFDRPTLWLFDVTLLTVFPVSARGSTFLTLRSGIKYWSVCMVTTYWQAAVSCDLNCSATVLLLFFVLHLLISNTADNLLCLEDKGRSFFNMNWTFHFYHEWCSFSPVLLTAPLVAYLVLRKRRLVCCYIKMCKPPFYFGYTISIALTS